MKRHKNPAGETPCPHMTCKQINALIAERDEAVAMLTAPTTPTGAWQPISKTPDLDGRLWPIVVVRDGQVKMDYEYYHFDNGWASDEEILNWWNQPIIPVRGTVKVLLDTGA